MSALALEQIQISDCRTEDLLLAIQDDLLHHAEAIDTMLPDLDLGNGEAPQYFFNGDNAYVGAIPRLGGMSIHYSNIPLFAYRAPSSNPIELMVGYDYDKFDDLHPLPLIDRYSLVVSMSSQFTSMHHRYHPKAWKDGGYSLETTADVPSLDQQSIARLAAFASQLAGSELVPVKARR